MKNYCIISVFLSQRNFDLDINRDDSLTASITQKSQLDKWHVVEKYEKDY